MLIKQKHFKTLVYQAVRLGLLVAIWLSFNGLITETMRYAGDFTSFIHLTAWALIGSGLLWMAVLRREEFHYVQLFRDRDFGLLCLIIGLTLLPLVRLPAWVSFVLFITLYVIIMVGDEFLNQF